jgi:hypothetical protein
VSCCEVFPFIHKAQYSFGTTSWARFSHFVLGFISGHPFIVRFVRHPLDLLTGIVKLPVFFHSPFVACILGGQKFDFDRELIRGERRSSLRLLLEVVI